MVGRRGSRDARRAQVRPDLTRDAAGHVEFAFPDEEANDSITLAIDGVHVAESTVFRLVPGDEVPEVDYFLTRSLEFRDDYRKVSATAYIWGDLLNTNPATLLQRVEVGILEATCPLPPG